MTVSLQSLLDFSFLLLHFPIAMTDLVRDTVFGHFVRLITNGRFFQYAEEKDPSLWKQYIDREQTRNMAMVGNPEGVEPDEKKDQGASSEESSQTRTEEQNQLHSTLTGQKVDPEKGRDATMVTWFGDSDPEVRFPQNA